MHLESNATSLIDRAKDKFATWKSTRRSFATSPEDGIILELKREKDGCHLAIELSDRIKIYPAGRKKDQLPDRLTEEQVLQHANTLEGVMVFEDHVICLNKPAVPEKSALANYLPPPL